MLLSLMSHSCPTPWHMSKFMCVWDDQGANSKCCGLNEQEGTNEGKGSETVYLSCLEGRRSEKWEGNSERKSEWEEVERKIVIGCSSCRCVTCSYGTVTLVRRSRYPRDECIWNSDWLSLSLTNGMTMKVQIEGETHKCPPCSSMGSDESNYFDTGRIWSDV